MSCIDHECNKKDKRLLVLLVFGVLILLSDIAAPAIEVTATTGYHVWLELPGECSELYRLQLSNSSSGSEDMALIPASQESPEQVIRSLHDDLKQKKIVTMTYEHGSWRTGGSISPRLAYFLGMPFSINIASAEELTLVPGIGPALAANIIDYRRSHGPVNSEQELVAISGIGPRMKRRLQNYFTYVINTDERE